MNVKPGKPLPLLDCHPAPEDFLGEVLESLRRPRKTLPCKYFYDERGSRLFDRICELSEYYPTRTELGIMDCHLGEMAASVGPNALVVEYGSGSGVKTRLLLKNLQTPAGYIPVEISRGHLLESAAALAREFPRLPVLPVCADFTKAFELPELPRAAWKRVVYFPGSTIGNFARDESVALMRGVGRLCGSDGGLLIGVDLVKDRAVLEAAYDDPGGVTRDFNLNLLARINRELGADFRLDRFRHLAPYNARAGRIEMYLESLVDQTVHVGGEAFRFRAGERIHTENSHKYTLAGFARLARRAGLRVEKVWTDPDKLFSVQYLRVERVS